MYLTQLYSYMYLSKILGWENNIGLSTRSAAVEALVVVVFKYGKHEE